MSLKIIENENYHRFIINRPQASNAINLEVIKGFERAIQNVKKKKPLFVFLEAEYAAKRVFCAGGDLKGYAQLKTKASGVAINRRMAKVLDEFSKSPSLFIALVDGICIGGGCETILACDQILATDNARFQFGQIHVGLTPGWGGGGRLLTRVNKGRSLEWLMSGRIILPEEAARAGLVDAIISENFDHQEFVSRFESSNEVLLSLKEALQNHQSERGAFEKLWWSKNHLRKLGTFLKK